MAKERKKIEREKERGGGRRERGNMYKNVATCNRTATNKGSKGKQQQKPP